jgi:predicted secreted protein
VKSHHEAGAGDLPPGADAGAPVAPMLARKALWTTLVSAVIFAALDAYMFWAG